jgi:hypothetical protein
VGKINYFERRFVMNLIEMKEQLTHWMNDMKHGYRNEDLYMVVEDKRILIYMFTLTNEYRIVAVCKNEGVLNRGYLGATASSRTPRAGEDWTRGNDLADGDFSKNTWHRILSDIVGYELVKIHRPVKELIRE